MVDDGLAVVRESSENEPTGGPRRRYYRRTDFGRAVARAESERLRALLKIAVATKVLPGETK
jgi:DNA-binding PadR family transcriptional regulator